MFTQIFEHNKVNQIHGIKWIFFSLFPVDENKHLTGNGRKGQETMTNVDSPMRQSLSFPRYVNNDNR